MISITISGRTQFDNFCDEIESEIKNQIADLEHVDVSFVFETELSVICKYTVTITVINKKKEFVFFQFVFDESEIKWIFLEQDRKQSKIETMIETIKSTLQYQVFESNKWTDPDKTIIQCLEEAKQKIWK